MAFEYGALCSLCSAAQWQSSAERIKRIAQEQDYPSLPKRCVRYFANFANFANFAIQYQPVVYATLFLKFGQIPSRKSCTCTFPQKIESTFFTNYFMFPFSHSNQTLRLHTIHVHSLSLRIRIVNTRPLPMVLHPTPTTLKQAPALFHTRGDLYPFIFLPHTHTKSLKVTPISTCPDTMLLPYSRAAVHLLLVGLLVSVAACVPVNVSAAARTRFAEATVRNRDSVYGEQRREYVRRVSGRRASKPADSEDAEGGEGDGGADGVVGKRKRKGKPTAQSEDAGGVSGSDESKGKPEMDPEDGGDATDPDNGREGKKKNKEPAPEDDGTQEGEEGKDDGGDEDGDDSATDDGKGDASDSGAENAPDASTSGQNSSEGGGAPKTTADNNPNTDTKDAPNDRGPASDDGNNSKSPRSITPRLPSPPSVGGSSFFTAPKSVIGMIGGGVFALVAILVLANTSVCGRGRAEDQPYEPVENANAGQAGFAEGEEVSGWNDGWGQDEWEEGTEAKV